MYIHNADMILAYKGQLMEIPSQLLTKVMIWSVNLKEHFHMLAVKAYEAGQYQYRVKTAEQLEGVSVSRTR